MSDALSGLQSDSRPQSRLRTWDLLRVLGFVEDAAVMSDPPGGLSFDFGSLKLEASHVLNRWCQSVVLLTGVIQTPRTIAQIQCEMPHEVESRELGVAWVTWCLDSHSDGLFEPVAPVDWLTEGREYRHLLPWELEMEAYVNRPRCRVRRDWARLAFRDLAEILAVADNIMPVTLTFEGGVLKIRCGDKLVAMPATGGPWPRSYSLIAASLRWLPKRVMTEEVEFSIRDVGLTIGNRLYRGVVETGTERSG